MAAQQVQHGGGPAPGVRWRRPSERGVQADGTGPLAAAFTLLKCNWGIGMMGMPFMLNTAGTISGVVMFVASMALTQLSIARVLDVGAAVQRRPAQPSAKAGLLPAAAAREEQLDYSGIMSRSLGGLGEWLALLSIIVSAWGSCIAYLLFIKDNLHSLWPGLLPEWLWVLLASVPLALLSLLDDVRRLAPVSVVGLACAFSFACLVVAEAALHLSADDVREFFAEEPLVRWKTLPLAMAVAAFCNEGKRTLLSIARRRPRCPSPFPVLFSSGIVILTPSTRNGMRRPGGFLHVSGWTIAFFTVCYMAVGLCGNIRYAGHVEQQLSLNFDMSSVANRVAVLMYCLQLIPTYCVVYFCAYEASELKFIRERGIERHSLEHKRLRPKVVLLRWLGLGTSAAIALVVPRFGDYIGLIGAVATSLAIYILPHVAWLRECRAGKPCGTVVSVAVAVFGVLLAVVGTIQSVQGMLDSAASGSGSSSAGAS